MREYAVSQITRNTNSLLNDVIKLMHINEGLAMRRDVLSHSILHNDEVNPFIVEIYYFIEIMDHMNGKFDR